MIRKGTRVVWKWGKDKAFGKVKEIKHHDVSKKMKGSTTKRKGSKDEPVYVIEQEDGDKVLKSASEVKRAS